VNRGARLLEKGRAKQAIPLLEKAHSLAPDNAAVCINLGGAYILAGRHRAAVPVLEAASRIEPDNPMIWVNLGAAYLGNPILARDLEQVQAIEALRQAVALNPATPHAYYNLGLIYRDRQEWALALEAFEWAVKVNPLDQDARGMAGRMQQMLDGDAAVGDDD
jgi:tetratricopeptide (TPR) repeat protein